MAVKTYHYSTDKNVKLQPNFRVSEFRCKDGTDIILIDDDMVAFLQRIRDSVRSTSISISSGYRTKEYNKRIGGSATSKHCLGRAADFCTKRGFTIIKAVRIATLAEIMGIPGIEIINDNYLHIDTRTTTPWYAIQKRDGDARTYYTLSKLGKASFAEYGNVSFSDLNALNPFDAPKTTVKNGSKGDDVKWVQWHLVRTGFLPFLNSKNTYSIDGSFGSKTEAAVKAFQKYYGLTVDGKAGAKTRAKLMEV